MKFKGKSIGAGDKLFTAAGEVFTITDWSTGTGDIYGRTADNKYTHIKLMVELYWNPPFMRRT